MNGQRGQLRKLVGRVLVSLVTTAVAAALLAPTVAASPIGDAEAAMMAAWDKAGGPTSPLGARKGDVYPVGDGFALDFDGGKMFYTADTGAKYMYGPILDKYESLGGAASSDLGWPTINEVPGLAGPDSRAATFSASDKPVIFWTPDHGAFVVRGALNAAWDRLGSSGGVLGAPVGDETFDGEVISQKFAGGAVSWNKKTKDFATEPAALADQLKGLQVPVDPTAAINMAWRAAGGVNGPLGAKQGGQQPIGGDGIVQPFAGGKVYFSPATGANALESDILAKYESLGGPVGSDLGFPTANESDGGIGPSSRIATFSASDKPVIFWTPDHGAFVVRGAIKAAWDKLRGPTGKLGAPVADQATDGDSVSQRFTGGKIAWNRDTNTFSTDPANLAPLLSGLQVAGQNQPSGSTTAPHAKGFAWQWWWLVAAVAAVLLVVLVGLLVLGWWRRRDARRAARAGAPAGDYQDDHTGGYDADARWPVADAAFPGARADELDADDPDAVDTTPTPVVSDPALSRAVFRGAAEAELADDAYPEDLFSEGPPEPAAEDDVFSEGPPPDVAYPDEVFSEGPLPDIVHPDDVFSEGPPETVAGDDVYSDDVFAEPDYSEPPPTARTGRHHAAVNGAEEDEPAQPAGAAAQPSAPARRPTIHMPLADPYQVPEGYPVKASAGSGLYYLPDSALYDDTVAEIWFASEDAALSSGFVKAD
ncbi:LGFP repeat-containing protein [Mycobacterium conspicuum]|uniref:LGFP repeat-containing protein n=1 Tax=Mycobacterium conspicuum TaxID=44010 RepID=UPI00111C4284|nr:hypothetical protein [Mycobacterium conspicuum]